MQEMYEFYRAIHGKKSPESLNDIKASLSLNFDSYMHKVKSDLRIIGDYFNSRPFDFERRFNRYFNSTFTGNAKLYPFSLSYGSQNRVLRCYSTVKTDAAGDAVKAMTLCREVNKTFFDELMCRCIYDRKENIFFVISELYLDGISLESSLGPFMDRFFKGAAVMLTALEEQAAGSQKRTKTTTEELLAIQANIRAALEQLNNTSDRA